MNIDTQSVNQTVSAMAVVLARYLHPEEVKLLTTQWQQYSTVSVKMMQQCVLDATRRYPELQEYKSDIRKGFWNTMQTDHQQVAEEANNSNGISEQKSVSELLQAFYTVMEAIGHQLAESDKRSFFHIMHQTVSKERTFKGHSIDINQFLEGARPVVPDNEHILNNLIQLAYICLCDIAGPVEADEILFQVAETAKQSHTRAVVERLF
jgi:hypothetical protein